MSSNVQHQIWQFSYGCLKQHVCYIIHPTTQSIDICVYDLHTRVYHTRVYHLHVCMICICVYDLQLIGICVVGELCNHHYLIIGCSLV